MKRFLIALLFLLWPTFGFSQSVPLTYFGLSLNETGGAWPKIPYGTTRSWDVALGAARISWRPIETSRGNYTWTNLDAAVAIWKSHGLPFVYTFGNVPDWANGGGSGAVPPTDFNDFYDFVQAVVVHLGNDCNLYELWNEPNGAANWTGTVAQQNTMALNAYAKIKLYNPNALVLSPATAPDGLDWMNTFLANGGGAYFDIYALHPYPWTTTPAPPEYVQNIMTYHNNLQKAYGYSKPIWATEFAQDGVPDNTPNTPVYTSIAMMMPLSMGADRAIWYSFNADNQVGDLAGTNQGLNTSGAAYRSITSWLLNSTFTVPLARVANANGVRTTDMTTAVAGTGGACGVGTAGTLPTHWGLDSSVGGISTQVVSTGTVNSVTYMRFAICGTAAGNGHVGITPENFSQQIAAVNGQHWTYSINMSLVGGSLAHINQIQQNINEYNSSGAFILDEGYVHIVPTLLAVDQQRWWYVQQLTGGGTVAYVNSPFTFGFSAGAVLNLVVDIALPSLDNGTIWQGDLTRGNGAFSRIVWDSAGGPTTYSTATACNGGACGYWRDVAGASHAIVANSVSLTASPIILDTSAQAIGMR